MATVTDYPMTRQGVRDLDRPLRPGRVKVGQRDGAMSAFAGAILAGFGLARGGLAGFLLVAAGGAVVFPWIRRRGQ